MHEYSVNIARRVKPDTEPFGPYHTHHLKVLLPATTKREALELYDELHAKYPEPEYQLMLMQDVKRTVFLKGGPGAGRISAAIAEESAIGR